MRGDFNVFVLALDLLVPPLSLLALLIAGAMVLTSSVALLGGPWLPALITGGNLVGFIYVFFWLGLNLGARFFLRMRHYRSAPLH